MFDVRDFLKQSARDLAGDLLHPLIRLASVSSAVGSQSRTFQVPNDQIYILSAICAIAVSTADNVNTMSWRVSDSGGNILAFLSDDSAIGLPTFSRTLLPSDLILPPLAFITCVVGFTGFAAANTLHFSLLGVSIPRGNFDSV